MAKRRKVCRKFGYTKKRRKSARRASSGGVRVAVKAYRMKGRGVRYVVVKSGVKKFRMKGGRMSSGKIFCGAFGSKAKAAKRAARVPKTSSFSCG